MNKKIAVLGGSSFIGRNLITLLGRDNHVFNFSRKNTLRTQNFQEFVYPDTLNFKKILDFEVIIYCIGSGIQPGNNDSYESMLNLNFRLPVDILIYLNQNNFKGKIITFGSYFEIGINNLNKFFTEIDVIKSTNDVPNFYCLTKRLITRFSSSNLLSLNHTHLVLPNVYGPGENKNRLIPLLIDRVKNQKSINLTDGNQVRQFLHVNDLVSSIKKIIYSDKIFSGVFNISPKDSFPVSEVVKLVLKTMNSSNYDKIIYGGENRYDNTMKFLKLDNSKLKKILKIDFDIISGIKSYL